MSKFESIYDHVPIFLQNFMCSVSGWIKYRERYKGDYWKDRGFCKEFDLWPLEKQLEYQQIELQNFVSFAATSKNFSISFWNNSGRPLYKLSNPTGVLKL